MNLELLIEDGLSKVLRPLLRESHQSKRISQGYFRDLAHELERDGYRVAHVLNKEEIQLPHNESAKLILVGGSDATFGAEDLHLLEGRLAFVQNLTCPMSETLQPLPIGIEDYSYARNGMPWNFRDSLILERKSETVLVGPFRPTSPSRIELLEAASNLENCSVVHARMPALRYARLAASHRFIACPEGNGIDTHRFWEALYRGAVPVVLNSAFSRNWKALGVPMVLLEDWRQLERPYFQRLSQEASWKKHWTLNPDSWRRKITQCLQEFDNYL